jgi:uncharacterized protein (TIGR02284 family)
MKYPNGGSELLNKLIRINLTRAEVYRNAFILTNDAILKRLFNRFFTESITYSSALSAELLQLRKIPPDDRSIVYRITKTFIIIQMSLTCRSRRTLLFTCEQCEQNIRRMYAGAIQNQQWFSNEQVRLVSRQQDELKSGYAIISKLLQPGQLAFNH